MAFQKLYLGDGVYVQFDGYALILTTEDGIVANTIVLEPEVFQGLLAYAEFIRAECAKP